MSRLTFLDILDPHTANQRHRLQLDSEIASARLQLMQQQQEETIMLHDEKMAMEREKLDFQKEQSRKQERLEREKNDLELIKASSDHIRNLEIQSIQNESDLQQKILDMRHTILATRAEIAKQKILEKQKHQQDKDKMILASELELKAKEQEFLLGMKEKELAFKHQQEEMILNSNLDRLKDYILFKQRNYSVTYDSMNDIIKQLVEKILGLGQYQATNEDFEKWAEEAQAEYEQAEQRANT